jgi:predicted DNA-binding protein (MmcQ/YjbR family)
VSHPKNFADDDPVLARLREVCLAMPGADEKVSHGRPCFFTKKIFAVYGAVTKGDHHSGRYDQSVLFLPDSDEAPAFEQDERFFVPAYYGPYGWWGLDLSGEGGKVDWDEVGELIDSSFRNTAPKKLIAELET